MCKQHLMKCIYAFRQGLATGDVISFTDGKSYFYFVLCTTQHFI
jgi:hypothetical protein